MTNHSPIAVRLSASSLFVVGLFERVGKTIPRISGYFLVVALTAVGCGSTPTQQNTMPEDSRALVVNHQLVSIADSLLGTPYRYGGASPKVGLDCSGLVLYPGNNYGCSELGSG